MTPETSSSKTKRIVFLIIFGILLILIIWLGLKTWRIYQTGQALLERKTEIETLMAGGLSNLDPDKAESLVLDTRSDIQTLKRETAIFMPLTPYLRWVPKFGSTLVAAPSLMNMAESGMDAAAYGIRGLKPALTILQGETNTEGSMISQLSGVLVNAIPDLTAANNELSKAAAAQAEITHVDALPGQLQTLLKISEEWLPITQNILTATAVLPDILGENGPRTYLLIAQNQDELRPTGGFISSAGTLVVENGKIKDLQMFDANQIDNFLQKPYDFPPQQLYDYMGIDLLLFRDANFWPDFPTTAEKAMDLYSYGQDQPPLDGVIAFDQEFIKLLIAGTGPINIQDGSITIDQKNIIDTLQEAWGPDGNEDNNSQWVFNRKAFIGTFAAAIIEHLENNFSEIDPVILAKNMNQAIAGKHLQLYMRQPNTKATLDQVNWDGRLENPNNQDFLAVVDTNMGFNKANLRISRETDYHISLDSDGTGEAKLKITYTHNGPVSEKKCLQYELDIYSNGGQYLDLADKCYWNYLRVYVPEGSQLISATGHYIEGELTRNGQPIEGSGTAFSEQPGFTTLSNFLLVPFGEKVSSDLQYQLPQVTSTNEDGLHQYSLTIRKQAGTLPEPVSITVTLPDDASFIESDIKPDIINNKTITFDIILNADKTITLSYQ